MSEPPDRVAALPPGARLLHIGIPKTGTTALQRAAAARRADLRALQVLYPGRAVNHREPVCALMGRGFGWAGAGETVPSLRHWEALRAEIDVRPAARTLVSHEFVSESTVEQARRFAAELGPDLHIAITLRGFAALLPSSWQQYVKAGRRKAFRPWLREVLADQPDSRAARNFYRRNDQGAIVRRWSEVVGPQRVIVVVADKARPTLLTDAFEDLLGLPRGLLQLPASGVASNRALSWPEAELLRRLNFVARRPQLTWDDYDLLVRGGGVTRLLEGRQPSPDEPAVRLPPWAVERATARARAYAAEIAASGCRVIGDLDGLVAPVPPGPERLKPPTTVPIDAAVELAAGLVSGAMGRGAFLETPAEPQNPGLRLLTSAPRRRRWVELATRNRGESALDLLVVAGIQSLRTARSRFGRSPRVM